MTPPVATARPPDAASLVARLDGLGVLGVSIGWVDNNGIVRSRVVPLEQLASALVKGVGITAAFGVFDSHDGITFTHEGLATPSGDVRLVPVVDDLDSIVALAGQPGLAWAHGRQLSADGDPWPYDQRAVLERQVAAAAEAGFEVRAGFEVEMVLSHDTGDDAGGWHPARRGPAYSANAVLDVHDLVETLLRDLRDNGVRVGQLHAEYGEAQLEVSLDVADALAMADAQVLTRQTVHAAARAHGLRASFAPLTTTAGAGNGWHLHTSLVEAATGRNALTGDPAAGGDEHGLSAVGRGYLAGLLRELPGLTAVTAPSTGSLLRRRPGYWAGAYAFWGVENREAALRLVPGSRLLGAEHTNVELKACDASANPYLALAVTIGAGLAGVRDGLEPPPPVQEDVGTWDAARRAAAGIRPLATTFEEQQAALLGSVLVHEVLGADLLGAFAACRASDAAWAEDRGVEDVVASLRWQY